MNKYLDFEGTAKLIQEIKRKDSQILSQLESGLNDKADKSTTYTKTEVGELISPKANSADLATVATSGSYADLSDKPHIPEDQVQADWNESDTNDSSFIQNKPTNVSAFTNDAGYLTQHQDISGKANSADLATVATSGSYADLSNTPTNVSTFTNDANYVTQDTLDDILGVDVNGLTQIKEVLSDDDTTTGLINLIGQKVDAEDIQSITSTEINRLFNPALFLRTSAEADTTSIVVNELGKVVKFDLSGTQYVLVSTSGSISSATVSQYADSITAFGQATAALEVTDSNGTWEFAYNGTTYTFSSNAVSPVIAQF